MRRLVYCLLMVIFVAGCFGGASNTKTSTPLVQLKSGMSRISVARETDYSFFSVSSVIHVGGQNLGAMDSGDSKTFDIHSGQMYLSVKTKKNPGAFKASMKIKPGVHYSFEVTPRTNNYNPKNAFKLLGEGVVINQNLGPLQVTAVSAERILKEELADPKLNITYAPVTPAAPVKDPRDAEFREAQLALRRGNEDGAFKVFLALAESGHAKSQFALANFFIMGISTTKAPLTGLKWLKKAVDQGHVDAMGMLAGFYLNGELIKKNVKEALNLRVEAALTGDALSQYNLATIYLRDDLGYKNLFEAVRFLQEAADQNLQLAQYNLGAMYMNGEGTPIDYIKAYKWLFLAANRNGAGSRIIVGMDSVEVAGGALEIVQTLEGKMSEPQLVRSRRLISQWRPK